MKYFVIVFFCVYLQFVIQMGNLFINQFIIIMKKVVRFFAMAAFVFGMTAMVSCGKDDPEDNGGNGGNGGNTEEPETGDPVLLDEGFESGLPSTWTLIDADGDGYNWICSYGVTGVSGNEQTDGAMYSQSYNQVPLTPDNYLVTPTVHIPGVGGYNLTWYVAAQDASYPDEKYAVYAGTIQNGVFVPSGNALFEEIVTAKGAKVQGTWRQRSVNLDAYKGQDIQIAFRHYDCTDAFYIVVDDIKISNE